MPNVHVTPDPDGWRISAVLPTKAAAEAVARRHVALRGG